MTIYIRTGARTVSYSSPCCFSTLLTIRTSDPNMRTSNRSASTGRPESIPGLRWTVDWSRTDFTDKIAHPFAYLATHPELVLANPKVIQRDENGYPISAVRGPINLAAKVSEYVETSVQYSFDTDFGRFTPRLSYSRFLEEYLQVIEGAEPIDRLGTHQGSDRYRLTGQLTWQWGRLAADLFVYYTPDYTHDLPGLCGRVVGRCESSRQQLPAIDATSLTTVDGSASYRFDNGPPGACRRTQPVQAGVAESVVVQRNPRLRPDALGRPQPGAVF